ncbi:MAG TPA: bacteriohopanetetrol glucosamine biosynthesis glycosyltransferase HpnI [Terriglobales bacterium]|nr:bacteriohopanetetrol glucosamine biosynthesis glycosyltransferase HpnI [Terriglobales bacterium]
MQIQLALQIFCAVMAVCGIGFYALSIWSARQYIRERRAARGARGDAFTPPVSILKPLRGTDPHMYESFRSHCLLDYPEYELIFGVSEPDDPVIPLVERLKLEFPQRSIQLVHCSRDLGPNTKVSNLIQMLPLAKYEYVLVNDSDIHVPSDYLRQIMQPFQSPEAGLVTCLYRGHAGTSIGSRLEAIGISTEFMPGVLTARKIEHGMHFALGSTLAMRREALQAIGGFDPLLDYLADDFELGYRISQTSFEVALADVIVDTSVPDYSLGEFFNHQLRWGRSTRDSRRYGYLGLAFTFGLPWAILAVIFSRGAPWAWALLGTVLITRLLMATVVGHGVLHDRQVWRDLWLVPMRELVAAIIWLGSFVGHTITWRGRKFLLRDKRLYPAA